MKLSEADADARIYPCNDCGKLRSKNEGGTVFTVCDECWDRHNAKRRAGRAASSRDAVSAGGVIDAYLEMAGFAGRAALEGSEK